MDAFVELEEVVIPNCCTKHQIDSRTLSLVHKHTHTRHFSFTSHTSFLFNALTHQINVHTPDTTNTMRTLLASHYSNLVLMTHENGAPLLHIYTCLKPINSITMNSLAHSFIVFHKQ